MQLDVTIEIARWQVDVKGHLPFFFAHEPSGRHCRRFFRGTRGKLRCGPMRKNAIHYPVLSANLHFVCFGGEWIKKKLLLREDTSNHISQCCRRPMGEETQFVLSAIENRPVNVDMWSPKKP